MKSYMNQSVVVIGPRVASAALRSMRTTVEARGQRHRRIQQPDLVSAMNAKTALAMLALAASVGFTPVQAAVVTWGAATTQTGLASDILTAGSLHGSAHAGSSVTVNGVQFAGQSSFTGGVISFVGSPVSVSGIEVNNASFGSAPTSWDSGYRALVGNGAYRGANIPGCSVAVNCPFIDIGSLIVGREYTVQIFEAFWNNNWATTFVTGASQVTLNLSGANQGAGSSTTPQYVIGTFTADAASQRIYMTGVTDFVVFNSIQVRSIERVPEPKTLALVGIALIGLALSRRAKRA